MARFAFRLRKVLEYRELQESWAKTAYLEAQQARLKGDAELALVAERRSGLLAYPTMSVADRIALEHSLFALDDIEHQQKLALQVLLQEESVALSVWQEKRRDGEVLRKLRERAYDEWSLEQGRLEQAALDEWAVLRRAR